MHIIAKNIVFDILAQNNIESRNILTIAQ